MVGQDATHHLRGDAEEVRSVLPVDVALADQAQERFVDEVVGLKGLPDVLVIEVTSGQAAQLVVDQGHELVERLVVAAPPLDEEPRHVVGRVMSRVLAVRELVAHEVWPEGGRVVFLRIRFGPVEFAVRLSWRRCSLICRSCGTSPRFTRLLDFRDHAFSTRRNRNVAVHAIPPGLHRDRRLEEAPQAESVSLMCRQSLARGSLARS
jgi:hypothetical protein